MSYSLKQTRRFARAYKKLHDNVGAEVDAAAEVIADNPAVGERKKGDLAELFVYKFRSQNQLYPARRPRSASWPSITRTRARACCSPPATLSAPPQLRNCRPGVIAMA